MPEIPFFDQAASAVGPGRTTPDRLDGTVALVTGTRPRHVAVNEMLIRPTEQG